MVTVTTERKGHPFMRLGQALEELFTKPTTKLSELRDFLKRIRRLGLAQDWDDGVPFPRNITAPSS